MSMIYSKMANTSSPVMRAASSYEDFPKIGEIDNFNLYIYLTLQQHISRVSIDSGFKKSMISPYEPYLFKLQLIYNTLQHIFRSTTHIFFFYTFAILGIPYLMHDDGIC